MKAEGYAAQGRTAVSAAASQDARIMDNENGKPISGVVLKWSASSSPPAKLSANIRVRHQMKTSHDSSGAELGRATPEGYSPQPCRCAPPLP